MLAVSLPAVETGTRLRRSGKWQLRLSYLSGRKELIALMSPTKEQLEAGITSYLAFCHREQTAARASELAGFLRVRYRTLRRVCNQLLGVPVVRAIRARQLEVAVRLLCETNLAIDKIGFLVGFGDRRTFFRAIRREFGCSPLTIRKAGQNFPSTNERRKPTLP
jgi:AraC-like DNA-binding protein